NGHASIHACHQVRHGHTDLLWASARHFIWVAGQAHEPADTLDHKVISSMAAHTAGLSETGYRAIHQIGFDGGKRCVIQSVTRQIPHFEVFNNDISGLNQFADDFLAFSGGNIDG